MTFKHKLSKRLAISQRWALLVPVALVLGCDAVDQALEPSPDSPPAQLSIIPDKRGLDYGDSALFRAVLIQAAGDTAPATVTWSSSDERISDAGVYPGDSLPGVYTVTAAGDDGTQASAMVGVGFSGNQAVIAAEVARPGTVSDLAVASVADSAVTLRFTAVDDGTGAPAKYDVRWAAGALNWGSAASTARGTCTTPIAGTDIGAIHTCTVTGLSPETAYQFRLVPFRGTLNLNAVFGLLSNVTSATTAKTVVPNPPEAVTDLAVVGATDQSVTLQFTEVDDGTGQPASYDVRAAVSPIGWGWGTTPSVTQGTCATPVTGKSIGGLRQCTVDGLSPATAYDFQLAAYRGTFNVDAVFGDLSNVASGATEGEAPVPVASVAVSPATLSLIVGASGQLSATVKDAAGNSLAGRVVTWSSSAPAIATVSAGGLVSAVAAGTATITATSEGKSAAAAVSVTAPAPVTNPGRVTDLRVTAVTDNTVTLAFTEVSDGAGAPASYDIRAATAPIGWGTAASVTSGSCSTPVAGTGIGASHTCTVSGLAAGTAYEFQLVAFRGTLNVDAVFGEISNTAAGTTTGAPVVAPVASVTVSPSSASIAVGGTQQLSATLRDAQGNILTGRSVTWSSANVVAASVNGTGLVTGLVPGSATISATSEGKSGSATVTVTASLPPPNPAGWPNAPSSWSVLTDQPGDVPIPAVLDGAWTDGWRVAYNAQGYTSIVPDLTSPHSPGSVIQMRYPAGYVGGGGPGMPYRSLTGVTGVYVGLWWKVNQGWDAHVTGSNKLQYLKFPGANLLTMIMYGNGGGRYEMRVYNGLLSSSSVNWFSNNVSNPAVTLGEWHQVEWLVEYTPGGTGRVRWWLDGQLVGDHSVPFPNQTLYEYQLNSVWGGTGDVKTRTDYYWYDHVHIRTR